MGTAKHRNIIRIETVRAALVPFKEPDLLKLFSAFGKLAEAETLQEKRKFSSPNASVCAFGLKTRKGPSGSVRPPAQSTKCGLRQRAAAPLPLIFLEPLTNERATCTNNPGWQLRPKVGKNLSVWLSVCLTVGLCVRPCASASLNGKEHLRHRGINVTCGRCEEKALAGACNSFLKRFSASCSPFRSKRRSSAVQWIFTLLPSSRENGLKLALPILVWCGLFVVAGRCRSAWSTPP